MSLPSKAQQIAAVAKFLDSDRNEGRDLDTIAGEIVEGYLNALTSGIKKPAQPIRLGMLFKSPIDAKTRRIAWMDGDRVWFLAENASYGWLGSVPDEWWQHCEEYIPKKRVKVGEANKLVEMTDEDIAEAWENPDWEVGVHVSLSQRVATFEIIATGPRCVLMRDLKSGQLQADSNDNLAKHYRREIKVSEISW